MPEEWREYRFCISSIVETELWAGVFHAGGERERKRIESLLSAVETLTFDQKAAEESGKILASLSKKGMEIGDFDVLIAGHALSQSAVLATKNKKHFRRIAGLELI